MSAREEAHSRAWLQGGWDGPQTRPKAPSSEASAPTSGQSSWTRGLYQSVVWKLNQQMRGVKNPYKVLL